MYKISSNNISAKVFCLISGSLPLIFYFGMSFPFHYRIKFDEVIIIYCAISLIWLFLNIKFVFLAWDFYVVKGEGVLFKRWDVTRQIPKGSAYTINTLIFFTSGMDIYAIKFDNGPKFHFRYYDKKKHSMGGMFEFNEAVPDRIKAKIRENI